jgi:hypothetical protein
MRHGYDRSFLQTGLAPLGDEFLRRKRSQHRRILWGLWTTRSRQNGHRPGAVFLCRPATLAHLDHVRVTSSAAF